MKEQPPIKFYGVSKDIKFRRLRPSRSSKERDKAFKEMQSKLPKPVPIPEHKIS